MPKARNFKELHAKMSPERQAANAAEAARMLREMPLDELRGAQLFRAQGFADSYVIDGYGLAKTAPIKDVGEFGLSAYGGSRGTSSSTTRAGPEAGGVTSTGNSALDVLVEATGRL